MIKNEHYKYIEFLHTEFINTHEPWHPAYDRRAWQNYLRDQVGLIMRFDSSRGQWLDFRNDRAMEEFAKKAEQYQFWQSLTT